MKRLLGLLLVMGMVGRNLSVAGLEDNASFQRNEDDEVVGVKGSRQTTDDALRRLKKLPRLKSLGLRITPITDAGLVHLKGLTKLQTLSLETTQVTDAGLVHLKGLTRLQVLYLGDTKVNDAGVAEVQDREVARPAPNLALGLTASSHFHSLVPRDCLHLAQDVVNH